MRVAHPEPEVDRHLVVARARRVQAAGGRADQMSARRASTFMWMSSSARENLKVAGLDLAAHVFRPVSDSFAAPSSNDALLGQHRRMGDRAADVLRSRAAVETDRGVDRLHDRGGAGGKTSAPHLVAHVAPLWRAFPEKTHPDELRP